LLTGSKPRRADALRNEGRIIEAALTQFSKRGITAPLDEIAKGAGVGPGTLYRHFPTRDELIASTLRERLDELKAMRDSLAQSGDASTSLQDWLRALCDYFKTFKGLADPMLSAVKEQTSALSLTCTELQDITAEFLQRAQDQGVARPNVAAKDLFLAQLALAWVEDAVAEPDAGVEPLESLLREGYAVPTVAP
jgi:AcrR family transcriptional regulator